MKESKPNRLREYDYSNPGFYYITLCLKDGLECFGSISGDSVELTQVGRIAEDCWIDIPGHFSTAETDEYVLMPDHLHGILVTDNDIPDKARSGNSNESTSELSVVIGSYKSAVSRKVHRDLGFEEFEWQESFYDRVIRDYGELEEIRKYIRTNPRRRNRANKESEDS